MFGNNNMAGKRVEGLRMTTYILIKHARLSQKEVSDLLGKDKSAISKYLQDVKNLDLAWRPDRESLEMINRVERYFKTIIELKNPNGDNNPT
jgi:predicted transcriptional regulator